MKILVVSEFHALNTGYAIYYKNICEALHKAGHKVTELASYGNENIPEHVELAKKCPWDVFLNIPNINNQEAWTRYNESKKIKFDTDFCSWNFENIVLECMPDVVIAIRDHWYDKFILDSPLAKYYRVILSPTVDSCFIAGTPILCKNDVKNIEDIKIGDFVLTHTGEYKKVLNTFKNLRNKKKIYELRCYNFSLPVFLTEDHPVLTIKREKDKYTKDWKARIHRSNNHKVENAQFIECSKINKKDYLVIPPPKLNVNIKNIDLTNYIFEREYYEENNQIFLNSRSHKLNKTIPINDETLGLFGLYIAEGSCGTSFSVAMNQSKEQEYLKLTEDVLLKYFNVKTYCKLLEEVFNNMFGKGCYNKSIPDFIFNLPVKKLIPFLEKLFIGDGSDTHSPHGKRVISYATVSKKLAIQIFYLLLKCGCLCSISCKQATNSNHGSIYYLSLNGIHCKKLAKLFNWDSEYPISDLRNDKSWIDEHGNAIILVKHCVKTNISDKYVYNFETEDHHTYCTGFIVHNCPQRFDWLHTFSRVDALTFYTKWSEDWMKEQYNGKNMVPAIDPAANPCFRPINKKMCRGKLGLPLDKKILLTVMRNQNRKQFPALFEAFSKLKDKSTLLYCHTHFEDKGWDIPKLLLQNGIANRVYFTYKCRGCSDVSSDILKSSNFCKKCGNRKDVCSVQDGVTGEELNFVYNSADLYVQWANCLPPGEQVLLKRGWTNIEDVKLGDIALTHKNNWKPVVNTFEYLSDCDLLKLSIHSDIETVSLTPGHKLFAITKKNCNLNLNNRSLKEAIGRRFFANKPVPEFGLVKAEDLEIGDFIAYPIDRTEKEHIIDLTSYIPETYTKTDGLYNLKSNKVFSPIKLNIDNDFSKWIGLYVADGCVPNSSVNGLSSVSICSNLKDTKNIELSKRVMSKFGNVKEKSYKQRKAIDIKVHNKVFATYLLEHCKKHEFKKLPDWAMILPINKQKNILQGLFMGDGCYFAPRNISIYNTISKSLAEQIKCLCRRIGINYNCTIKTKGGNRKPQYRFEIRGNISNGEFCTKKTRTCNFVDGDYYYYQIKNIEKIPYIGLVHNFEVQDDNSYVSKIGAKKNSEGLGYSQLESAACGIKMITVNYSAPEDVAKKTISHIVEPIALQREMGTLCNRAVPDNDKLVDLLDKEETWIYDKDEVLKKYKENYDWEKTGANWVKLVESLEPKNNWGESPILIEPPSFDEIKNLSNYNFVISCILNVVQDESLLGTILHCESIEHLENGKFIPEDRISGIKGNIERPVTKEMIYNRYLSLLQERVQWERKKNACLSHQN